MFIQLSSITMVNETFIYGSSHSKKIPSVSYFHVCFILFILYKKSISELLCIQNPAEPTMRGLKIHT